MASDEDGRIGASSLTHLLEPELTLQSRSPFPPSSPLPHTRPMEGTQLELTLPSRSLSTPSTPLLHPRPSSPTPGGCLTSPLQSSEQPTESQTAGKRAWWLGFSTHADQQAASPAASTVENAKKRAAEEDLPGMQTGTRRMAELVANGVVTVDATSQKKTKKTRARTSEASGLPRRSTRLQRPNKKET